MEAQPLRITLRPKDDKVLRSALAEGMDLPSGSSTDLYRLIARTAYPLTLIQMGTLAARKTVQVDRPAQPPSFSAVTPVEMPVNGVVLETP
jgi:hypothetical protein